MHSLYFPWDKRWDYIFLEDFALAGQLGQFLSEKGIHLKIESKLFFRCKFNNFKLQIEKWLMKIFALLDSI